MGKPQSIEDILNAPTRLPAIITRVVEDGEGGYSVRASCPFLGTSERFETDYGWNPALHSDENHAEAALKKLADIGYSVDRRLIMGRISDDKCVFVQVPAYMLEVK